jgi:hypothetical protein
MLIGFWWESRGRRALGRPRHRWEDNIQTDLRYEVWGVMDWIHLAQDRGQWRALVYLEIP